MNNQSNKSLIIGSVLAVVVILAVTFQVLSQSSEPSEKEMKDHCQTMMEHKQNMMAEMKAQDADITEQIAKMNSAPNDKKLDLLAAVVTHMAAHHAEMNTKMETSQAEMMTHMTQHIKLGNESMTRCPMMQGMKGMADKSTDPHKEHQEGKK